MFRFPSQIHHYRINKKHAFAILSHLYGDPSRLARARKNKLILLGMFPYPGSKSPSHVRQQMEWLLSAKLLIKDLMELAAEDEDCYCEVYNPTMLRQIKAFFPIKNHEEMSKFQGSVKDKFEQLYDYIIELRQCTQTVLKDIDDSGPIDEVYEEDDFYADSSGTDVDSDDSEDAEPDPPPF